MEKVYLLAASTDADAQKLWRSRAGDYGLPLYGFMPVEDNAGNLISGPRNAEAKQLPFADEIKACEMIAYVPKVFALKR